MGRSREDVVESNQHSNLCVVVTADGQTVACARMITDQRTFGWVGDVFVDGAHRGPGMAKWMVGEIVDYWISVGVRRVLLATRDAHEVCARVDFDALAHPELIMQIDRRSAG